MNSATVSAAAAADGGRHSSARWNQHLIVLPFLGAFLLLAVGSFSGANFAAPVLDLWSSPATTSTSSSSSRVAVCLVGGARRFELTGPSIVKHLLRPLHRSTAGVDVFLHSPLDENTYKLSLLKDSPSVAAVRIFTPAPITATEEEQSVLAASEAPNGIPGLLQYFNLVQGCLDIIKQHESQGNFTYGRIVRARVDSFWSGDLHADVLRAADDGAYVVPQGSRYGGFNDRLGVGDRVSSVAALSRLALLKSLATAGLRRLNSESVFLHQLTATGTAVREVPVPFCILTERWFGYPPDGLGLPMASVASPGPLSGLYCRPCAAPCAGECADDVCNRLVTWWSWSPACRSGVVELCDSSKPAWDEGWEKVFDGAAGRDAAAARKKIAAMEEKECVRDMEAFRAVAGRWDAPSAEDICKASRRWSS